MIASGDENEIIVYTDAGSAGADTKSQSGLVIVWAGSIITWRSSKASLSALGIAEAELCAAALAFQVLEGIRLFLQELGISLNTPLLLEPKLCPSPPTEEVQP